MRGAHKITARGYLVSARAKVLATSPKVEQVEAAKSQQMHHTPPSGPSGEEGGPRPASPGTMGMPPAKRSLAQWVWHLPRRSHSSSSKIMERITENLGWPCRMARLPDCVRTSLWTLNSLEAVMATDKEPSTGPGRVPGAEPGSPLARVSFPSPPGSRPAPPRPRWCPCPSGCRPGWPPAGPFRLFFLNSPFQKEKSPQFSPSVKEKPGQPPEKKTAPAGPPWPPGSRSPWPGLSQGAPSGA